MPFEQHHEKTFPQDPESLHRAALAAAASLGAAVVAAAPERGRLELKFPKTILGKTLGERTYLACEVRPEGAAGVVVVDAYPLDAVERKLLFGARKGVTLEVVNLFLAHLERQLG